MRRTIVVTLLLAAALLVGAACGEAAETPQPDESGFVSSDAQRVLSPQVPASDREELAAGTNEFAFDLYHALAAEDGNLFYSPYSISLALAMTYAGARGETEQQMADTLHFTLPQDRLHPAFNALDQELASRGKGAKGTDEEAFRLNIANAIWGQKDYGFLTEFLDVLAKNYGAGLRLVDFEKEAEKARVTINDWVADETEGKIEDLIPPGVIDDLTRLVLTNAIYFNAAWAFPFEEEATQDGPFHTLDGREVQVPMMSQVARLLYAEGEDYQAVELPYDGGELSMIVLVPDAGEFEAFEGRLNAELLNSLAGIMTDSQVTLTIPKFEYDSMFSLRNALTGLGMPRAFSDTADFSGMNGEGGLYIQDVLHKAFVSVDEKGTEAAAATAVVVGLTSAPSQDVELAIDRPFVFLIRDVQTGAVLFAGRVLDPTA
jgi:serpin B